MRQGTVRQRQERGMSLTLVAVSLTAMAAVGALAVDLGMMYKARADALSAAEAAALAGASVFLDVNPDSATADARAHSLAEANTILHDSVTASEVQFGWDLFNQQVRVRVARAGIGTWFARVLGENSVQIGAVAAAGVTEASGANCVTPIMIPDVWDETNPAEDPNGSNWEEPGEQWSYDPLTDSYGPFNPNVGPGGQTGYGSPFRTDYVKDFGRQITLRPQTQTDPSGPGHYRLWTYDGESPDIAARIQSCDSRPVGFGTADYDIVPLGQSLPLGDLSDLIADDPGTSWDVGQNQMQSSSYSDWRQSPRVIKVALFDPANIPGMQAGTASDIAFNNIVLFFLENVDQGQGTVTGRLLYYALGNNDDGSVGPLVKRVRLVE